MNTLESELKLAEAEEKAAHARREVALLRSNAIDRECDDPECPGPKISKRDRCPMGYAGSCRMKRRY